MKPKSIQTATMKMTTIPITLDDENELSKEIAKIIQEEIDAEILEEIDAEILFEMHALSGWHRVRLDEYRSREHSVDILHWAEEHCTGKYDHRGTTWVFESDRDAAQFLLRWR